MEFFCRKLDNKTFDVFEGKQYHEEFWTRLKAGRHGVYIKQGRPLTHNVLKTLTQAINPLLNEQVVHL